MNKLQFLIGGCLTITFSSALLGQTQNRANGGPRGQANSPSSGLRPGSNQQQQQQQQATPSNASQPLTGTPGNNLAANGQVPSGQAPNGQPIGLNQAAGNQGLPGQPSDNQGPVNLNPTTRAQLPPEVQNVVEQWLDMWQRQTDKIDRYSCKFRRWEFNASSPAGQMHSSAGIGDLKYMKPDKGVFKVEELYLFQKSPDGKPDWKKSDNVFGEWWICNGQSIFEFNRNEKQALEFELPQEMRGAQISESPLPFVFGIEKNKVLQRYYIEPGATPVGQDGKPRNDVVALDAYPKRMDDSLNYQKVTVILNRNTTLPVGMIVVKPESRPELPVYDNYEFFDEQINASLMDKLKESMFTSSFIPNPPKDYQIVKRPYEPQAAGQPQIPNQLQQAPTQPGPRSGQPPVQPGNGQRVAQPPAGNRAR